MRLIFEIIDKMFVEGLHPALNGLSAVVIGWALGEIEHKIILDNNFHPKI